MPVVGLYSLGFAMSVRWRFGFDTVVGQPLSALAIAVAIGWCIANAPRALNTRPIRVLGILSYSIYLYQQFWLRDNGLSWPVALAGIVASACASYALIERPFLALRQRLEGWRLRYPDRSDQIAPS